MNGTARSNGHARSPSSELKQRRKPSSLNGSAVNGQAVGLPKDFWTRWEVPRKVLHSSIGFVTLGIYFLRPPSMNIIVLPLCGVLAIVATADAIRLRNPAFERTYERFLGPLMRDSEKLAVNGVVWYLVGVIFVLSVYPKDVAVESILLLSWADTAASITGRLWGHLTPKLPSTVLYLPVASRKSLAGVFGSLTTAALTTMIFWGFGMGGMGGWAGEPVWRWSQPRTGGWFGLSVLGMGAGTVTSIAEVLDLGAMDDNLTLPIISGALIWTLTRILHIISTL